MKKQAQKKLAYIIVLILSFFLSLFISTNNVCKYETWKMTYALGPGSIDIINTKGFEHRALIIKKGRAIVCVMFCYGDKLGVIEINKGHFSVNFYMPI